jgi:hypothetical protein
MLFFNILLIIYDLEVIIKWKKTKSDDYLIYFWNLSNKSKTYSFFLLNSSIFNQLFKHITSFIVSGNNLFLFVVINSSANENFSSIGTLVPGIAR